MSFADELDRAPIAPGQADGTRADVSGADVPLDRDVFLRQLLRELAGTLENVVGLQEAAGYISVVGGAIGDKLDAEYRQALGADTLSREQVIGVLIDLKRRIEGDFFLEEDREDRIVLGNRVCPFGEYVNGRPSLCMMTSNVFGSIAAENLGYARVEIAEALALGHRGCRVIVHLKPSENPEPGAREYFRKT
jgi:predicted ArsR family transcriptional regulator